MNPALLLPVFVLLASSVASAQQHRDAPNWVRIKTENDSDTTTFVDLKSIRAGNGYRLVWVKEVFKANPNGVSEIRVQYEVDCKDPGYRILRSRTRLRNGSVQDRSDDGGWFNILSDETGGLKALQVAVCGARVGA